MKKGKIIIISGPSGSGKTTLYKKILSDKDFKGRLVKTVSVTTRSRRAGEKNGRDYIFVSPKMFLYKRRAGHFLESQKVYDNYYGTPNKAVKDLLNKGINVLLCIDVKGAKVVSRKCKEVVRIFVKAQSLAVLKSRLKNRGSENGDVVRLRMEVAKREIDEAKRYDFTVINDNLNKSYRKLKEIVKSVIF